MSPRDLRVAAFSPLVIAYLTGAFVAWDVNPGHWDTFGRWITAVLGLFASGMTLAYASESGRGV